MSFHDDLSCEHFPNFMIRCLSLSTSLSVGDISFSIQLLESVARRKRKCIEK